ncbi:hypothetical protein [Pedobacter borealis]|uniref:hypothetical protein n=1 Tax=Pedobacter borealis TaxID=475254 RepID=UPI0004933133|nr:hypothetical protein [Pedobacter borealis]
MNRIYVLALLVIVATACNKEASVEQRLQSAPVISGLTIRGAGIGSPYNPNNPADSIGIIHNLALNYVYNKMLNKGDTSRMAKRNYILDFFRNRYGQINPEQFLEKDESYKPFKSIPIGELTARFKCSPGMGKYINRIINDCYLVKKPRDYMEYFKRMAALEDELMLPDSSVTDEEKQRLLHLTSITRHSMWFWMNAVSKEQGETAQGLRKFIRALLGLQADQHYAITALLTFQEYRNLAEYAADESAGALFYFDAFL